MVSAKHVLFHLLLRDLFFTSVLVNVSGNGNVCLEVFVINRQ